jgi:hypothetical protein
MKLLLLFLTNIVAGLTPLLAFENEVVQVRAELLIVRMPEQRAIALRERFRDPKQTKIAHDEVLRMIDKKEADLVDWPILTTKTGNRAVSENLRECRFPGGPALVLPPLRMPIQFENRNAGATLEIEPVTSPESQQVDLQISYEHGTLLGLAQDQVAADEKYAAPSGQPTFERLKTSTNLTLNSGEPHLLSFHKLKEPKNTIQISILTTTVIVFPIR